MSDWSIWDLLSPILVAKGNFFRSRFILGFVSACIHGEFKNPVFFHVTLHDQGIVFKARGSA